MRETRGENILVEFEIDKPIYLQAAILRFQYPFFDLEVKRSSHQPQKKSVNQDDGSHQRKYTFKPIDLCKQLHKYEKSMR